MTHKIAILGASGYTGAELVRLIATHPTMEIVALAANSKAGLSMSDVFPHLRHLDLPDLVKIDQIDFAGVDLCFCALPHATSQAVIKELPKTLKIVDLSADFRLRDPEVYAQWYGGQHDALECQAEAVYGLTEFYRDDIRAARLVAGTGCNAATGQYALRPLIADGLIDLDDIIIDLKTGVSGAGTVAEGKSAACGTVRGCACLCRRRHAPASGGVRSGIQRRRRAARQGAVHAAFITCKQGDNRHCLCEGRR